MLGFTFSGGGMKIGWHLGVYKALLEEGLEPDITAGTSAGSLITLLLNYNDMEYSENLLLNLTKLSNDLPELQ